MYYRKEVPSDWSLCEIKRIDKMQLQVREREREHSSLYP